MARRANQSKRTWGGRLLALLAALAALCSVWLSQGEDRPFEVHFLDVGQADCALVICDGKTMLVDGGNIGDGPKILEYLRAQGVQKLDVLIASHPHADHIGGLPDVVREMEVTRACLSPYVHTSATYASLLDALDERGTAVSVPKAGDSFTLGGTQCQFVGDGAGFDDANNSSLILRAAYGDTAVLFTGDAETPAEEKALENGLPLEATVLKVGHHGSNTSTGKAFLAAVAPDIAVISVGEGNSYGHPAAGTLKKLTCTLYRTDRDGTVVLASDGSTFGPKGETTVQIGIYIGNIQSGKYHRLGCRYLPSFENMDFFFRPSDAAHAGYVPCGVCQP